MMMKHRAGILELRRRVDLNIVGIHRQPGPAGGETPVRPRRPLHRGPRVVPAGLAQVRQHSSAGTCPVSTSCPPLTLDLDIVVTADALNGKLVMPNSSP